MHLSWRVGQRIALFRPYSSLTAIRSLPVLACCDRRQNRRQRSQAVKIVTEQSAWEAAYRQLELHYDRPSFDTWIRGAVLLRIEATDPNAPMAAGLPASGGRGEHTFVIGVPTVIGRDMLQHRLYRNVRRVLSDCYGQLAELRFEHVPPASAAKPRNDGQMPLFQFLDEQNALPEQNTATPEPLHARIARPQRPDLPDQELNPRYTLDRFLPGTENALVFAAATAVAESNAAAYNPLYIHGGVGMGKTHLLHAIAQARRARGQKVVYISSEMFTNDLIDAIRQKTTAMFREKYRSADVLLVDDIQFIGGKDSTQEEFFHTFNALYTFGKQIVLAGDRPPSELNTLVDRLRSRFEGGLVCDLRLPELETRAAILRMWATDRGVEVDDAALMTLAARAKANIRELEGVFNQLCVAARFKPALAQPLRASASRPAQSVEAYPMQSALPIDDELVEDALSTYQRPRRRIAVEQVIARVARHYHLLPDDLIGARRNARINEARQVAMYLSRELTAYSLPQIGDSFGGRKHSTILYACNEVQAELGYAPRLADLIERITAELTGDAD